MLVKRLFDLLAAMLGLVLLFPLMGCICVWIKLHDHGPVLFRQKRVGRNEMCFDILKFRTMIVDAEKRGGAITIGGDPRIIRSGHFLRKYKIDELPQLINVLRGDMSFVGPRPEVPEYVTYYPEEARKVIFSMRPGITDNTAIMFYNENTMLERMNNPREYYIENILPIKIKCYVNYVQSHSFVGDIMIIYRTILVLYG